MTPLDAALAFATRGWRVFPCIARGPRRKHPLTPNGFHDASIEATVIAGWWCRWPDALIGVATGARSGFVVLDIDVKHDRANGFDTLDALGVAILPDTPLAHTPSGGAHVYFAVPDCVEIRNTAGERGAGIGPGLDWRGEGGYAIAPSLGSGYSWDPIWNLDTVALAPVPEVLLPRQAERVTLARPVKPTVGLAPYGDAALDSACRRIIDAPAGEQELTVNFECFAIGTLAGAGRIPADFARRVLIWAARRMPDHDPRRPWRPAEIEAKVIRAFDDGMRRPRKARCA